MRSRDRILPYLTALAIVASSCTSPDQSPDAEAVSSGAADTIATTPADGVRVAEAIRDLDRMRSSLASGIQDEAVDQQTFAQVCKPVGMRAKQLAEQNGWVIRQLAIKYRNPNHEPDGEAASLFARFQEDGGLDSLWIQTDMDGQPGWRYLRRISVERACLSCHGDKDTRPSFVAEGYPDDRAYGFVEGDLRGLYSVFVPGSTSTMP